MKSSNARLLKLALAVLLGASALFGSCGPSSSPVPTVTTPPPASSTTPVATSQLPPTATGQVQPPPTTVPGCTDRATFDRDVSIPPGTMLLPGQSFVKTWRLVNSGTCTWTAGYALVFAGGDNMGGSPTVPLPGNVSPGGSVDLSIVLTSPAGEGTYEGRWLLRGANGNLFGSGDSATDAFLVTIQVAMTPVTPTITATPAPISGWLGEYYDNADLTGSPVLTRDDAEIDFDWGSGPPAQGLPSDAFSVRWTRTLPFEEGTYQFFALSDDGVRVWIDGQSIIDEWHDAAGQTYTVERNLKKGDHTIHVEYYDLLKTARIRFWWTRSVAEFGWKGAYYANAILAGAPVLLRYDTDIDFDWGSNAPAGMLPADNFSARWTRTWKFEGGLYRFRAEMDDGMRLWVDDILILDGWSDGPRREVTGEHNLSEGEHEVRVEYYERGGGALIQLSWENLSYPDWRGAYWSNRNLSGDPVLVQNEGSIEFNWGLGSAAAGMPADNFSARWTRSLRFDAGNYRFHALVDDGGRLWVDDKLIIDAWEEGPPREVSATITLSKGLHSLRVEYFEGGGEAQVRVWWEKTP